MEKTAMIYDVDGETLYFVVPGDWRKLCGEYLGATGGAAEQDLLSLMYTADGTKAQTEVSLEEFRQAIVDGAYLIECGECY